MKLKVVYAGIAASICMAAFSHALSVWRKRHYNEPEILGETTVHLYPEVQAKLKQPAGWLAHLSLGTIWAGVYMYTWKVGNFKPDYKTGLLYGVLSGLIAIPLWKIVLKLHPTLKDDYKDFYLQLIAAHIVFAEVSTALYNKSSNK